MISRRARHSGARWRPSRRGAAAVELAIILPVSITLVLGCVDFARVIHAQIALTNAARVGADYGATHRFTDDTQAAWDNRVREIVAEEARAIPSFVPSEFQISIDVTEVTTGTYDVSLMCNYDFQTAVNWPGMPSVVALRHRVTMRQYQ